MGCGIDQGQLLLSDRASLDRLARSLGLTYKGRPKKLLVRDILRAIEEGTREYERQQRDRRRADAIAAFSELRDSAAPVQEAQ